MSFSPKYGMIMADGAGDARNGKTPPCGVCGAQNAAVAVRRAAVAASSHPVTKNARRRTYCTQNGLRRRLVRRFPQGNAACRILLPCACCRAARLYLSAVQPAVSARCAAGVGASTAQASVERAARGTVSPFAAAGIFRPRRASAGWLPSDPSDRVSAAKRPHSGRGRTPYRQRALAFPKRRICKIIGAWAA